VPAGAAQAGGPSGSNRCGRGAALCDPRRQQYPHALQSAGTHRKALWNSERGTVTLPHSLNPDLGRRHSGVPLADSRHGKPRAGDGNIYHESYDIAIQVNGLTTYSFPNVDLEQGLQTNSLADALTGDALPPATPVRRSRSRRTYNVDGRCEGSVGGLLGKLRSSSAVSDRIRPPTPKLRAGMLTGGTDVCNTLQRSTMRARLDEVIGSYAPRRRPGIDRSGFDLYCDPAAVSDPAVHHAVWSRRSQAHCTKCCIAVGVIDPPRGSRW